MSLNKPSLEVVNIVGTGDLGLDHELDIDELEQELGDDVCASRKQSGLTIQLSGHPAHEDKDQGKAPKTFIFKSGKYNLLGGLTSRTEAFAEIERVLETLRSLDEGESLVGENAEESFEIVNLVCTGNIDEEINLNALNLSIGLDRAEYEPERFSSLIYRATREDGEAGSTIMVSSNGGFVVVGGVNLEEMENDLHRFIDEEIEKLHQQSQMFA